MSCIRGSNVLALCLQQSTRLFHAAFKLRLAYTFSLCVSLYSILYLTLYVFPYMNSQWPTVSFFSFFAIVAIESKHPDCGIYATS